MEPAIWIAEGAFHVADGNVLQTKRIGVEYSGEDALLPYRFLYKPDP